MLRTGQRMIATELFEKWMAWCELHDMMPQLMFTKSRFSTSSAVGMAAADGADLERVRQFLVDALAALDAGQQPVPDEAVN